VNPTNRSGVSQTVQQSLTIFREKTNSKQSAWISDIVEDALQRIYGDPISQCKDSFARSVVIRETARQSFSEPIIMSTLTNYKLTAQLLSFAGEIVGVSFELTQDKLAVVRSILHRVLNMNDNDPQSFKRSCN